MLCSDEGKLAIHFLLLYQVSDGLQVSRFEKGDFRGGCHSICLNHLLIAYTGSQMTALKAVSHDFDFTSGEISPLRPVAPEQA